MSQSFELLTLQEIDNEVAALNAAIESLEGRLTGNTVLADAPVMHDVPVATEASACCSSTPVELTAPASTCC